MRRTWTAFLTVIAASTLVAASVFAFGLGHRRPAEGERENEALERAGHVGVDVAPRDTNRITRAEARALAPLAPAAGWAGEIKVGTEDTWEPTVAADPGAPYVYVMYNRFGGTKACKTCPATPMLLRVSSDNGTTWGPETFPCPCPGVKGFQYDPVLKVASNGIVYATWMNRYDMVFSKSSNHGATWTAPIEVSGQPWGDKPWIGVSPNGQDVYIAYSTSSDVWIAASHNAGASFAPAVKLNNDSGRYRYPNGFEVLANGTAVLSASDYPGSSHQTSGQVNIETWRSTNGGTSWARTVIDQVYTGVNFETSSTTTVGSDAAGTLVALYSGATTQGATGSHLDEALDRWRRHVVGPNRARPVLGERELPGDRGRGEWRLPDPLRGRSNRLVEHLVPSVDGRRGHVGRRRRHRRRRHGRDLQDRRRIRVRVRRLRCDRHHQHGEDGGGLGRGRELLDRTWGDLVQPAALNRAASRHHVSSASARSTASSKPIGSIDGKSRPATSERTTVGVASPSISGCARDGETDVVRPAQ